MRISSCLSDEQLAAMTDGELADWSETQAIGPWASNDVRPAPAAATTALTLLLNDDLARELEAEAALHRQACRPYARDLLLLALRQVQAGRRAVSSARNLEPGGRRA